MTMLTDLADACRKSGLRVVEVDGWQTRGHGQFLGVNSIVLHHTATSKRIAGDYPSLRIVRDGHPDLRGPLSQVGLGRSGTVYVIAAGVAWHAGVTFYPRQDNWHSIGIEAEHDGIGEWSMVQHAAYVRLVAALAEHYGIALSNVQGHKEVAKPLGRKIDPTFDMTDFRRRVWVLWRRESITAKIVDAVARKARLSERIQRWREKRASL
jgi:hypothetical protein